MAGVSEKFSADPEGINRALWMADKADLLGDLRRDPETAITSRLKLGSADQGLLNGMNAKELAELVRPVVEALETRKPFRVTGIDRGDARGDVSAAVKKCTSRSRSSSSLNSAAGPSTTEGPAVYKRLTSCS